MLEFSLIVPAYNEEEAIKILEAAAAGLPVVETELMATQLGWEPGVEIEAVDDPAQTTMKAVTRYGNAARWDSMQTAALLRLLS